MSLLSSIPARLVTAFMSLLILFCSTAPAMCQCHPSQTVPACIKQQVKQSSCCKAMKGEMTSSECGLPCCKPANKEAFGNTFNNQDCCCKTNQPLKDAILTSSHSGDEETNWTAKPDLLAPIIAVSSSLPDKHRHCVRKVASTFAPTGPPLYLLHRALLL